MANLTFGLEIECVLICPMADCKKMEEEGRCGGWALLAPQYILHDALSKPFTAPCHSQGCDQTHSYTLPMPHSPESTPPGAYDTWQAETDYSVGLGDDEPIDQAKYVVGQIELKSRILNFAKPTPCCAAHEPDSCRPGEAAWPWQWEVARVLDLLENEFNDPKRPGYRLKVNSSTGLHVHVGGVEHHLWPKVARGVTGLFTACERQIESILPDYRIGWYNENDALPPYPKLGRMTEPDGSTDISGATYCMPLSDTHIDNTVHPTNIRSGPAREPIIYKKNAKDRILSQAMEGLHVPAWLYCIYSARDMNELQQWLLKRNVAVNLINLVVDPKTYPPAKQTVEFRSHAGSLGFAEISAWVDLVVNVVRWSQNTDSAQAIQEMLNLWGRVDERIVTLAHVVGATTDTQIHYCRQVPKAQTPGSAVRRFDAAMEREAAYDTARDGLGALCRAIETGRMNASLGSAVAARIQSKFRNGLYGKFPQSTLTGYVRRRFGGDAHTHHMSTHMALADRDRVPLPFTRGEDPVAGWRRALVTLARLREEEAKAPHNGSHSSSSASSDSSASCSCCGLTL